VTAHTASGFYLNREKISQMSLNAGEVEELAGRAALEVKGVATYVTRTRLLEGKVGSEPVFVKIKNGFHAKRSPDIMIILQPYYMYKSGFNLTSHASPYEYDSHVPIIFFGRNIRPGMYYNECSPLDIAPTIATILNINAPSCSIGRVLQEALLPNKGRKEQLR
jgi:hypothetical protein